MLGEQATSKQSEKTILVLGDWVVDDNWVVGGIHRSPLSTNVGIYHHLSLHHPQNAVREICGAGLVASLLRWAEPLEDYNIAGVGLWHDGDTGFIRSMFDPKNHVGSIPYRVTKPPYKSTNSQSNEDSNLTPSNEDLNDDPILKRVKLHNLADILLEAPDQYFTVEAVATTPAGQVGENDTRSGFGTSRVFRFYQKERSSLKQLQRIDWELPAPLDEHSEPAWINKKLLQIDAARNVLDNMITNIGKDQTISAVVVKDMNKGVVSAALIELLLQDNRLSDVPWYIATRRWKPNWLKLLPENQVQLIVYSESSLEIEGGSEVLTWITREEHATQESIRALEAQLPEEDVARAMVVAVPSGFSAIAVERVKSGEHLYVQPKANPNDVPFDGGVGKGSALFSGLVCGMLWERESEHREVEGWELLSGGLRVAHAWMERERNWLVSPDGSTPPTKFSMLIDEGKPPVGLLRFLESVKHDDEPERLIQVGTTTHDSLPQELTRWDQAREDMGIITENSQRTIHIWRAATEIDNYVCCRRYQRNQLADLRTTISQFVPELEKRSVSVLLVADPGSGKTFLVESLAKSLDCYPLFFNVTTMNYRDELLSSFDQIVTSQAEGKKEKLLVFFDEVNAQLRGEHIYDSFLTPLEDGYYVRRGIKFHINPCIWLFASTDLPNRQMTSSTHSDDRSDKGSDFLSRLSHGPVYLSSRPNVETMDDEREQQSLEMVYRGIALAKSVIPDLNEVHVSVLEVLRGIPRQIPLETRREFPVRELRKLLSQHLEVNRGRGHWRDEHSLRESILQIVTGISSRFPSRPYPVLINQGGMLSIRQPPSLESVGAQMSDEHNDIWVKIVDA